MSLQGPFLILSDVPCPDLARTIERAGGFPVIEANWAEAASAIGKVEPAAIVLATCDRAGDVVDAAAAAIAALSGPFAPVIALVDKEAPRRVSFLPLQGDDYRERLVACLRAALRVRTLHAAVLRRIASSTAPAAAAPDSDPIEDAVVLVAGRGRSYPMLTTAIGERAGLIGALGLETAWSYLEAREIDALVIGDGFNRRAVADFIDRLGTDPRFRDLPIASPDVTRDKASERLPMLLHTTADPGEVAQNILPYARLHAFSARLKRLNAAFDAKGAIDPHSGLYTREAFVRDFTQAVKEAEARGASLSLARFSFKQNDARARIDAARLVSRLMRTGDFACRDRDGSILLAMTAADLSAAHVVARRIASVLKHTMLAADQNREGLAPTIALASFKTRDTAISLLARITPERLVAAE